VHTTILHRREIEQVQAGRDAEEVVWDE